MNALWDMLAALTLSPPVVTAVVVCCLLLQGFFSGSEIALVSCDKVRLAQRVAAGRRGARVAQGLLADPVTLFSTTLLGTNLSAITASTVTTLFLIHRYGPAYSSFALLLAPVILIAAEILPKSIYQHHADRWVDRLAPWLLVIQTGGYPIIWAVTWVTRPMLGSARRARTRGPRITRDELVLLLQGSTAQQSDIHPHERTMVARVLQLSRLRAKNVMVPLIELESLPVTATPDAAFGIFELKGVDRILMFTHRILNVVGLLEASDLLCAPQKPLRELMHPPLYVPETMRLPDLVRTLREQRAEAAVVVDEYGGAVGMVTMEEILEEVVGDIWDEFTEPEPMIHPLGRGRFLVQARVEIEAAQRAIGGELPRGDYETVGGLLLHQFGYIPRTGETLQIGTWQFLVQQANERSIVSVEIAPIGSKTA